MANDQVRNTATGGSQPDKSSLRKDLRARRKALAANAQTAAAESLTRVLSDHPTWHGAMNIALYMAADGEIDPRPLAQAARGDGKQVFLPVIRDAGLLHFKLWQDDDRLVENCFGIPEPAATAREIGVNELDIICLPLVGFDKRGGRLGMGGGYYDRSLEALDRETGPLLVGLAHECQRIEQVPLQPWDIRLDAVATESALLICRDRH